MSLHRYRIEAGERSYFIEAEPESRVAAKLKNGQPYEFPLLGHIKAQNYHGTAIDVGAHIGNHTLYMSVVCGLNVVAFEPIHFEALTNNLLLNAPLTAREALTNNLLLNAPLTAREALTNNLLLNAPLTARAYKAALGRESGRARAVGIDRQRAPAGGWGLVELTATGDTGPDSFDVEPLDLYKIPSVVLIKIDVEGMECAVLQGAEKTIANHQPHIYIEARDQTAHRQIEEVLAPMGYRFEMAARTATPVEMWVPK